ncbi:hypothetical protein BS47DRAFT_1339237 [Hydnum rufescens UP504]|uniref:RING-type domain-containing protein n=1 Tax=Hydnum rufescens UP504 TaxID=1448309 RepID=A0A9P6B4S1_9AGAM|nr:hypothetical protein BS47DRAFT_1339237 [Hydnum rufescens UP504]
MYTLTVCSSCAEAYESRAPGRTPHALPCGHVVCLDCARRPTLTPATCMSKCGICHVPYTKRDIYSLNFSHPSPTNGPARHAPTTMTTVLPDSDTDLSYKSRNGGSTSRLATQGTYPMNPTEYSSMARIVELESRLAVRDNELRDWRRQFDKNAQALLIQLREVRELKSEVLDWWRRFQTKDLELQALRRALTAQFPNARLPGLPPERSKSLNKSRIVTRHDPPEPSSLVRLSASIPPPYNA